MSGGLEDLDRGQNNPQRSRAYGQSSPEQAEAIERHLMARAQLSLDTLIQAGSYTLKTAFEGLVRLEDSPACANAWASNTYELKGVFQVFENASRRLQELTAILQGDDPTAQIQTALLCDREAEALKRAVGEIFNLTIKILREAIEEVRATMAAEAGLEEGLEVDSYFANNDDDYATDLIEDLKGSISSTERLKMHAEVLLGLIKSSADQDSVTHAPTQLDLIAGASFQSSLLGQFSQTQSSVLGIAPVLALGAIRTCISAIESLRDSLFQTCLDALIGSDTGDVSLDAAIGFFSTISAGENPRGAHELGKLAHDLSPVVVSMTKRGYVTLGLTLPQEAQIFRGAIMKRLQDLSAPIENSCHAAECGFRLVQSFDDSTTFFVGVTLVVPTTTIFNPLGSSTRAVLDECYRRYKGEYPYGGIESGSPFYISCQLQGATQPLSVRLPRALFAPIDHTNDTTEDAGLIQWWQEYSNGSHHVSQMPLVVAALKAAALCPTAAELIIDGNPELEVPVQFNGGIGRVVPGYEVTVNRRSPLGEPRSADPIQSSLSELRDYVSLWLKDPALCKRAILEQPMYPELVARAIWLLDDAVLRELGELSKLVRFDYMAPHLLSNGSWENPAGIAATLRSIREALELQKDDIFDLARAGISLLPGNMSVCRWVISTPEHHLCGIGSVSYAVAPPDAQLHVFSPVIARKFSELIPAVADSMREMYATTGSPITRIQSSLMKRGFAISDALVHVLLNRHAHTVPTSSSATIPAPLNCQAIASLIFAVLASDIESFKFIPNYRLRGYSRPFFAVLSSHELPQWGNGED